MDVAVARVDDYQLNAYPVREHMPAVGHELVRHEQDGNTALRMIPRSNRTGSLYGNIAGELAI